MSFLFFFCHICSPVLNYDMFDLTKTMPECMNGCLMNQVITTVPLSNFVPRSLVSTGTVQCGSGWFWRISVNKRGPKPRQESYYTTLGTPQLVVQRGFAFSKGELNTDWTIDDPHSSENEKRK